jgi:hypothetical protein
MRSSNRKVAFLLVLTVILALGLAAGALAQTWPDLTQSVLDDYNITEAQVAQISDGYTDGRWRPYAAMERRHFVKMAVEAYGIAQVRPATPTYTDVPATDAYFGYIEGATAAGLIMGTGGNLFQPLSTITREQGIAIIARHTAAGEGLDLATMYTEAEINALLAPFGDSGAIGPNLRREMAFAVDFGIVLGTTAGNLQPKSTLFRIQGAAMLIRSLDITPPTPTALMWGDPSLEDIDFGDELDVTVFFPGYANWQWLAGVEGYPHPSRAHEAVQMTHFGAAGVRAGTPCASCHNDAALRTFGERIVDLVDDQYQKEGYKTLTASAAHDATNFYLKVTYESQRTVSPPLTHQTYRFDGTSWGTRGVPRDFEAGRISEQDLAPNGRFDYEDRLAVMLNPIAENIPATDDNPGGFNEFGCFITCHSSLRNQPERPSAAEVQAHPYLGVGGLGVSDIRHYLLDSRTAQDGIDGNWADIEEDYDQAGQRQAGRFVDLWQARVARSAPIGYASNDYIMEYRHSGVGGVNPWLGQDPTPAIGGHLPWIYDPRVTGYWAIPETQAHAWRLMGRGPLVTEDIAGTPGVERNGVRFVDLFEEVDGDWVLIDDVQVQNGPLVEAGTSAADIFNEGDLIPSQVLRQPTGARADLDTFVRWDDGDYTVIFRRAIDTGNESDKPIDLANGQTMNLAVFDDNVSNRSHHVSLPFTLGGAGSGMDLISRAQ